MTFTPPPQNPNFKPGTGRLTTDRFDFDAHLSGVNPPYATNFRHLAGQIDLSPTLVIGGNTYTKVQDALAALADVVITGGVSPATIGSTTANLGIVTLGGDFGGTALVPRLTHLQGFALSLTSPPNPNDVLTWNGVQWISSASSSSPSGVASGDLSGFYPAPVVSKIHGATVPVSGALTIGNVLQVSGSSSLTYGFIADANVSASANIAISKLSGGANGQIIIANNSNVPQWHTISQDSTLSSNGVLTVTGIQGTAIDSHITGIGASQDGYVLTWINVDSQWEAKPTGASVILGGDVTGAAHSNTVVSISGGSPITVTPAIMQWSTTTVSPLLTQAQASTATDGNNLTIKPQAGGTGGSQRGGNLILSSGAGSGGFNGAIQIQNAGTLMVTFNNSAITLDSALTNPTISQAQASTLTNGNNLLISSQPGGTGGTTNGGSLFLNSGANNSGGVNGSVVLKVANNAVLTCATSAVNIVQPIGGISGTPLQLQATSGAIDTGSNIILSGAQIATPVIQLNGTVRSGGCTITVPNAVGAIWYFDITGVTFGGNSIIVTTGSGTTATISDLSAFVPNLKLITVVVVASHFVSVGGA